MKTQYTRLALLVFAALLALLPAQANAQQAGRITGTITSQDGQPVSGAYIAVVGTRRAAVSGRDGSFVITNVPEGTYTLSISHLAYKEAEVKDIAVRAGLDAAIAPTLAAQPVSLDKVVASASRQPQRITEAPATITKLDANDIANSVGNSFSGALKAVKGVDFIQVGVTSSAINARGFNSSFNNRMLMMEDGRLAVLPENGLPVGSLTTITKLDLASVEVLIGPGAALYGPDASNGVVTLTTKDPRQYPGASFEVSGGSNVYKDIQGRYAGTSGRFGYKATGEFQQANDWSNTLTYGTGAAARPETGVGGKVDWTSRVSRGGGSLYYYLNAKSQLELNAGMSVTDGVGQTNVGRNQLDGWKYLVTQLKYSTPSLYVDAYRTESKAGKSYALNRFTTYKQANPTKSDEELRLMSDWPSDGQLYAAEVQHNFKIKKLNNAHIIWGGQVRRDIVSSDRQWLLDRLDGKDLTIDQKGVYAQIDAPIVPRLNFVGAVRYDDHQDYDAQFSPKAGLVFKPAEASALRVTYNRAFKSPTTLQTSFYIPDFQPLLTGQVAVYGNTRGFTVKNAAGTVARNVSPLVPEENTTWEAGYKGVLADKLLIDVAGYHSDYKNFMSPLSLISNFLAGEVAYYADTNDRVDSPTTPQYILTYFNLGDATLRGVDAGVTWVANKHFDVSSTFSWTDLVKVEKPAGAFATDAAFNEAVALNAPVIKWTAGANAKNVFRNFSTGFTARHVTGYRFVSGINNSWVPTFNTLDMSFSYGLPAWRSQINAQVVNAYTCSADYVINATTKLRTSSKSECGFDRRHQEMVNMPGLGTMLFIGVRFNQ